MFKKFHPKEDVSSSTSLKSSVQRGIRSSLLTQMPFLTQSAYKEPSSTSTSAPAAEGGVSAEDAAAQADDQGDDSEDEGAGAGAGKKGKGKGGKGKGAGKGGKKGKGKDKEDKKGKGDKEEEEDGDGELLVIDEIWPKKEALGLTKCHDRISIYTIAGTPLFFNHFDGPYVPTMKLLHKYPAMLPHVRIDRGAIKFLLAGANMMAPGLLSPGGDLPDGLEKDAIVAIHAEGKDTACGIGKMAESSEAIKKAGKGVAIEVICWIGDDLWKVDSIGL